MLKNLKRLKQYLLISYITFPNPMEKQTNIAEVGGAIAQAQYLQWDHNRKKRE